MAYQLSDINFKTVADPKGFIEECDEVYRRRVETAADKIIENRRNSPIVLLSGPSGSGKTTTARKISEALERKGVHSHYVGMDDYFKTVDPATAPRTAEGEIDLESPLCLDMELLNEHFDLLAQGKRIYVPKYEFSRQMRMFEPSKSIKLKNDEVVVFEGIHALNDMITDTHPEAFKLYISARSVVEDDNGEVIFKGTWMRLMRRVVRDNLYRGTDAAETLQRWASVRRGEKLYISPFKDKADLKLDSSFAYEVPVLNNTVNDLFKTLTPDTPRLEELQHIVPAYELFEDVSPDLVAPDALLREFIGGGIYG